MSQTWLDCDAWNAAASPPQLVMMEGGRRSSSRHPAILSAAWPS